MTEGPRFAGRLGLQQRVLPAYRLPFFERLAEACEGGLSLFAGEPRPVESILTARGLQGAHFTPARNLHLLPGPLYLCYQRGLLDWLRSWDPDALVLEANPRYPANWLAVKWARGRGRPVVGWGLGAPAPRGPAAVLLRRLRRSYLSRFDALIAYSSLGAEQYVAAGVPRERVFVALNAVSPPPSSPPERPPLRGRPPRVLFVGRLQERKRVDLLLRACASLDPAPELWVVGDGPARERLERLAARVFPAARFTGALHGAALQDLWNQADLFALPGTGGLAVQQAMAHALPVIVAQGDGTQRDLVRPGNGWLVPAGDPEALTAALREALSDPARLHRMGLESHRIVREEVNIDRMVMVFMEALAAAAGTRREGEP